MSCQLRLEIFCQEKKNYTLKKNKLTFGNYNIKTIKRGINWEKNLRPTILYTSHVYLYHHISNIIYYMLYIYLYNIHMYVCMCMYVLCIYICVSVRAARRAFTRAILAHGLWSHRRHLQRRNVCVLWKQKKNISCQQKKNV